VAVVVLDASVLIAFLDASDRHHPAAVAAFEKVRSEQLVLPASAYAEVLVGPAGRGREALSVVRAFIADLALHVEPTSIKIAERAAQLRASHKSLRLPDALVIATADVLEATSLLTADRSWTRVTRRARLI
jgi:predicted nucleic acid-binding protein